MRKVEYVSPSGLRFVLREQTGEDDETMSSSLDETSLINTYVSNVIVEGPEGKAMSKEAVKKLRLGDKYFLVLASRILSLGETLFFTYQWDPNREPVEYSEDLSQYIWDYSIPFPTKDSEDYFEQRMLPYPEAEFLTTKIRELDIRMDYLDGFGEDYLMKLPPHQRTVNQELVARNLRFFEDGEWKIIKNFSSFSARDMLILRNLAHDNDPAIEGLTTLVDPFTGASERVPLLGIKDFFYPVKI